MPPSADRDAPDNDRTPRRRATGTSPPRRAERALPPHGATGTSLPRRAEGALDRRARLAEILVRDGGRCVWCGRTVGVGLVSATTEHVIPRVKGGPSWIENEVAACRRCNGERGHLTPAEWAEECRRRGWPVDIATLVRTLDALAAAIADYGGQRRARPYLDAQRRRLRNLA